MIPQGYKHTEIGIIPQEWHIKTLGAICDNICSGKNKNKSLSGNYPVYGSTGIIGYTSEFVYNKPTILVARVGANAGLINKVDGCFDVSDNTLIIDCKRDVNFNFLYELLQFTNFNKFVFGSGQPLITAGLLKSIRIPVPPVEEQRKIAEILGVWDKAIELQARLVDKLELRKRALMQRLLTGRLRLPGFSNPWQKVKLGDICKITTGSLNANAMCENGIYPFFTCAKEVYKINVYAFDTEALLISGNGEYVGYIHYCKGRFNAYQRTYVLDTFDADVFFLKYNLQYHLPKRILKTKSSGNTPYIVMDTLTDMELIMPVIAEQTAIADVLSTADKEIEIAKAKLAAYRTQKRGLMQQLLTGKKQVK